MLQPQIMKVDKKLVQGLAQDDDLRHSLSRLLKVAEVLGAEVVAEGIETQEDCRVLKDLGVRLGQGYLFGRPQLCDEDAASARMRLEKQASIDGATTICPESRLDKQA